METVAPRRYGSGMTAGNEDDLSWFYRQLTLDEQVQLITNPGGPLPPRLAERLMARPGISKTWWISNETAPDSWVLAAGAERKLSTARDQLDFWWQNLDAHQKHYIIENRAGELDSEYKPVVHEANRDPFNDPDAYLVVIVQDANNHHRFKLPPIIRAYVEMVSQGDPAHPTTPDWTRTCKPSDLDDLTGDPYMLRVSDDPSSPWRNVKTRTEGFGADPETGAGYHYMKVTFWDDDAERTIKPNEELEVGLIKPPWWPADAAPPAWPKR